MARIEKKLLSTSLVQNKLATMEQMTLALEEQKKTGNTLGHSLIETGILTEQQLVDFLVRHLGFNYANLKNYLIDVKTVKLIPEDISRKYNCIGLIKVKNELTVAMVDPLDTFLLDNLEYTTASKVKPLVSTLTEIQEAIDHYYALSDEPTTKSELQKESNALSMLAKEVQGLDDVNLTFASASAVVNLASNPASTNVLETVKMIMKKALHDKASDIHIEPDDNGLRTRFRIDGLLQEILSLPKSLEAAVISACKVMAELDIAEKRVPQDGRIKLQINSHEIDMRVSSYPTLRGEKIVMRILDKRNVLRGMEELGFTETVLAKFRKLIIRPNGIILVTGPTGSGKTSTLYAALQQIKKPEINIVTIEDPVEYQIANINQGQINPKAGFDFANGLRSILRQDPDVIMVGEIRDYDTAEIAIRAALTGHLVMSTLHTNDSAGAITRLIDMGVEPFLVASSIIGVMAQRLVRTICEDCKQEFVPSPALIKRAKLLYQAGRTKVYQGEGCDNCNRTGYKGRTTITELLLPTEHIKELIVQKSPTSVIKNEAMNQGMTTLRADGLGKVLRGITTLTEVIRVSADDEI
ncbi:MAG: Flp pilus assembly complex ATPase component TadA [Candidatus Riflebacteria bacterium]|nr:Flp pilus assembly complex ATPase component TadA [Candidatus Riflebacteria bacterium]